METKQTLEGRGHEPRGTWGPRSRKGRKDPPLELRRERGGPGTPRSRNWERMGASASFQLPGVWRLSQQPREPRATHLSRAHLVPRRSAAGPASRPVVRTKRVDVHQRVPRGWHVALRVSQPLGLVVTVTSQSSSPRERTGPCPVGPGVGPPCQQRPQRRGEPDPPRRPEFALLSETARRVPSPARVLGLLGRTLRWAPARAHAGCLHWAHFTFFS